MRAALWAMALSALLVVSLSGPRAAAHSAAVAVVELTELEGGRYTFTWRNKPNVTGQEEFAPRFPPHCALKDELLLDCGADGLTGTLGFDGLGDALSAAMYKINPADGATQVYTLTPGEPTAKARPGFDADSWAGRAEIAAAYTAIGIEHILLGVDHLLFVLGLIWISGTAWMLLKTITAFTLAHSVTLGAVTFGFIGVPEAFVNAMIALSIVFIGVEVIKAREGAVTLTLRNPWAVSFFFGLLHGFGFANALIELGLPDGALPLALLSFNIGVEIGQIGFVALVLAMGWAYRVMTVAWPSWAQSAPAYAIGGLAALWFLQRVEVLFAA